MAQFKVITAKKYLLFALFSCRLTSGSGDNTDILKNTETSTEATATLYCKSPISSIEWHHLPVGSKAHERNLLYQDGHIFNGYKERFNVNRKDNGEYNLVIKNVKTTDAGKYTCLEKSEVARQTSAELIVLEQYPSNKFCTAKYTCTPLCKTLELACNMKSHGKIIPSMEWRESTKGILTSNSNTENGTTISSIHVDLEQSNSNTHSYACRVKYPIDSSLTTQFSWSYLVTAPSSLASSSSDEKLEVQSTTCTTGLIVIITLSVVVVFAMAVVIALQFFRNKRITAELANSNKISLPKDANFKDAEMGAVLENKRLLKPEVPDGTSSGIVSCTSSNKNSSIFGIGVLDNELFLVTREECVIEVYNLASSELSHTWMVEGLINPCDMAVCPQKSLVFICDWKQTGRRNEIFCCDKNGKLCCRWIPENERGRISITKQTNVIVAENYFNTINEYTQSGKNVDKLRTGKLHLEHAVKLENGNYVASFGDSQDAVREICVIDKQGTILHSINQESCHKQIGVELSAPRTLVVDKEGNIYVSDLYNCRIILLNSELQYKRKIDQGDNKEGFRGPLRMCIHESDKKRQLLVADSAKQSGEWIESRILVLNLAPTLTTAMNQTC